ncbi:hypothetical protein ACETRX_20105 [Labrys portucalensis]|uniref:Uncharacterized protein n=1 Tax=Labrys neptuniae TaxID=376174 RepID=A0ABV6ZIC4_9HYPH
MGKEDGITCLASIRQRIVNFSDLFDDVDETMFDRIRRAESIGHPLGDTRTKAHGALVGGKIDALSP